jgi:hypothetical protein
MLLINNRPESPRLDEAAALLEAVTPKWVSADLIVADIGDRHG